MDVGRVCVKVAGKDAGKKCAIVEVLDKNFVIVSGLGMKRKRCNITHLEPTELKLEISSGASDEEVKRALEAVEAGRV
ncbi:MAG: 50S ribosomal protein L14e [Candidatus Hadarchaeota archaeon]